MARYLLDTNHLSSRSLDATLLTDDRDFEALPDLRIENWLG